MPKRTLILLVALLLLAALLFGIKINQWMSPKTISQPIPTIAPLATPLPSPVTYLNPDCGVLIEYPSAFKVEEASQSARLSRGNETIDVVCAETLPTPNLTADETEEMTVAGQKATVYHDADSQTKEPIDVVMFKHPQRNLEIAIFGYGEAFRQVLAKLQLVI